MAKKDSIFRYADSDTKPEEASVVPQIPKEAEQSVEEYEPPKIDRKRFSPKREPRTSKFLKGVK